MIPSGCVYATGVNPDIAAENGFLELVKFLQGHGKSATRCGMNQAAQFGHIDVVRYLHDHGIVPNNLTISAAAHSGHLDVLRFLVEEAEADLFDDGVGICIYNLVDRVAMYGHLEVLEYLYARGMSESKGADLAADYGHLDVVRYFRSKDVHVTQRAANNIARGGNLEMLMDLYAHEAIQCTSSGLVDAARCGHVKVVEFLVQQGTFSETEKVSAAESAAFRGRWEVLRYFESIGIRCTSRAADQVAEDWMSSSLPERLDTLKRLNEHGIQATSGGANGAARCGHLDILQYLHACGIYATEEGANSAAWNGHLEVLKYLHEHGIYATSYGADWAAYDGRLHIIRYLREHGIHVTAAGADRVANAHFLNRHAIMQDLADHGIFADGPVRS